VRLVAYSDNVEWGGADQSLAHVLARLDSAIDVAVVGVSKEIVERIAAGRAAARTHVLRRPRSGHDWRSLAGHVRVLRALEPDLVHANLSSPWSCQYCVAAAGILRRPRVVAVYQLVVPSVSASQRWAKRLTLPTVDRHVGVGEHTSREVEEILGLRGGSVATIHNGVPDEDAPEPPRPAPGPLIGAVGRIAHQKGFDLLVRALGGIEDATLVLVGEGEERPSLETLARSLGVADRIVWVGWSDRPRDYLGAFDVFVLPSRFEGFPLALLEAMLARVPVVATDVGSVSEAVRNGETGVLVPPEDVDALAAAITRLLRDETVRRELREKGRELVLERFTADHAARAFESLYRDLLE
jgi:glycosyltransferase involved in cell wall biosynthesis